MRKHYTITALTLLAILTLACGCNNPPVIVVDPGKKPIDEHLTAANRIIIEAEETQIDSYVERRGWSVTTLPCRVRLWEYQPGNGKQLEWEETVAIEYSIDNLTGGNIYSEVNDTVVVGRQQPTLGLDAALLRLHHGSKAYVIVPSNEGYGVPGDGDRITSRMILVYNVTVK
ncbi:MAG: FKBP-type peptidyl-prolyl cis-trans isomerase [Bacteroidales bacterium]|nr:FKBP-type peptidyl-prolyl cis-trans isomerase [Bacteroidales bacterium]